MLARENSSRNPARTAVTAGALTVGLALVAFIATLGAGLRGTINDSVKQQIHADYVISADNAASPPSRRQRATRNARASLPAASGRARSSPSVKTEQMNGVDPNDDHTLLPLQMDAGLRPRRARAAFGLRRDRQQTVRQRPPPRDRQPLRVDTQSAVKLTLTVRGIQTLPTFGALLGTVTISTALFDHSFVQPSDAAILASTGGATPAAQQSLTNLLTRFPKREGPHDQRVHQDHPGLDRHAAEPVLRPARAVSDRQPVRDRQHPGALDRRAHARDRRAPRDRNDTPTAHPDDQNRKRDHRAYRRGDRHQRRPRPRRSRHRRPCHLEPQL